jgi:hypothetical protein
MNALNTVLTSLATASLAASEEWSPLSASAMVRMAAACALARISITAASPVAWQAHR